MGIAKDLVRGTLEHGYEVLDAYRYTIESTNPETESRREHSKQLSQRKGCHPFYRAAKAYSKEEFLDHFNQIVDVNPKVAEFLARVDLERWSQAFCPANRYIRTIL
ncbi:hypothetical protein P3L10_028417 [Capsicum annuum]